MKNHPAIDGHNHRDGRRSHHFCPSSTPFSTPTRRLRRSSDTPLANAVFCQVFPRECTEVFLEGHKRAFAFFGGVPRRIAYDNTKTTVARITGSRERQDP
jgi:hypothetical protein